MNPARPTPAEPDLTAARLLAHIAHRLEELRAVNLYDLPSDRAKAGAIRFAARNAQRGILAMSEVFAEPTTAAGRKAVHRALAKLEVAGKVRRLRLGFDRARATHVQLCAGAEAGTG